MVKYLDGLIYAGILAIVVCFSAGNVDTGNNYKGIYYDDFKYTDNVTFNKVDGVKIDYNATLNMPGDYYELDFKVINSTSSDMKISDYFYHDSDNYIIYELTYDDGSSIKTGDIIKQGEEKNIRYKVSYINPIDSDSYTFDSSFNIEYEQVI